MSSSTNVATAAADRRPSTFLSLAPATSSSYPQKKTPAAAPVAPAAVAEPAAPVPVAETKVRRSSSLSSAGSTSPAGVRILKLGPVHWGEHLDEHKQDWHEVAIE